MHTNITTRKQRKQSQSHAILEETGFRNCPSSTVVVVIIIIIVIIITVVLNDTQTLPPENNENNPKALRGLLVKRFVSAGVQEEDQTCQEAGEEREEG